MLLINKETGILCFSFEGLCLENISSYNVNSCSIDLKFSPFPPFITEKKKALKAKSVEYKLKIEFC